MSRNKTVRIIAAFVLLVLFAVSTVPLTTATATTAATTTTASDGGEWRTAKPVDIRGLLEAARIPQGPGTLQERVYSGLLDPEWVSTFVSEHSDLLKRTYETSFGVRMESPFGLLVKLGGLSLPELRSIAASYGGVVAKYWRPINTALVIVEGDPIKVRSLSLALARAGAARVSPDSILKPAMWDTAAIFNMYNIWHSLGLDGSGVLVSVIDTGVDPNNPSIPNPDYWADFVNGNNATAYDDIGHGTHVAGIILGREYSLFPSGDAMWHAILVGESYSFNPPVDKAYLTYQIDVAPYAGGTLTVKFQHLYVLYEKYNASGTYYYFKANASVLVSFDGGSTWTVLATYGGNQTSPVVESLSVSVPSDATTMLLRFEYDYILAYNSTGGGYDFSEWDILGWYINNVTILSGSTVVYDDPVTTTTPPGEVVESYYWARVEDRFRGMAPSASLAAAKVCGTSGCSTTAILQAMNWSLNIGANIVSMSLGGPAYSYDSLAEMADYLVDQGVLVVIAAGNEGPYYYNVSSPGISKKALTVAAATKQGTIAWFSSPGPSPVGGWLKPDVAAFGYDLASSIPTDPGVTGIPWADRLPYAAWAGTSMATPMVSGLAALVMQAHPGWNASLVKQAIIASADWLHTNRYMASQYDLYKQGAGLIDPHQAVNLTVVPLEANIWLGNHTAVTERYINYTVRILNTDTAKGASVSVLEARFFKIIANGTDYSAAVQNVSILLESPAPGDTLTISPGGVGTLSLRINLTKEGITSGMYAGYILMETNTSGIIKVIFSAKIKGVIIVDGYVLDYETGEPIANATVFVYNLTGTDGEARELGNTTTGPDGYYKIVIPDEYARFFVFVDAADQGYFVHTSYDFSPSSTGRVTYTARLLRMPPAGTMPIIIIIDRYARSTIENATSTIVSVAEKLGYDTVIWPEAELGRIIGPILQGWMDLMAPATFYLAGGAYQPLNDPLDMFALNWAANNSGTLLVVSSGDLGWSKNSLRQLRWLVNVLHANYTSDLLPDTYTVGVYNVSSLSTLFGYDSFIAHLGSPTTTIIGNITVREIAEYYPDAIVPENGGVAAGKWYSPAQDYSMVLYLGGGSQPMKTAYLAFELEQLDNETRAALVDRLIVMATDMYPPTLATYLTYELEQGKLTLLGTSALGVPSIYDEHPLGYTIEVVDNATKTLIARLNTTTLPATIDLDAAGASPGSLLLVNLTVADRAGHISRFQPAGVIMYLEGVGANYLLPNDGLYNLTAPEAGVRMLVRASASASIQVLRVPVANVPELPLSLSDHARYRNVVALDVYTKALSGTGVRSITLFVKIPGNVDIERLEKTRAAYWNGTAWAPVSHYYVYKDNMTVKIVINDTTKPSIAELGGTPIVLSFPTTVVGGILLPATPGSGHSLAPIAGLLVISILAVAPLAWRRLSRK